jgi:uncharacterized protein YqiB (DUF1249 family)
VGEGEIMRKMIYETMFDKLVKLGILNQEGHPVFKEHVKLVHKPYMDLSIDRLSSEKEGTIRISLAHNFVQNGDLMADPDMEIRIYPELKAVEALTYQLDSLGLYQVVFPEPGKVYPKLKTELNHFLNQWLTNLIDQGFYLPQKPEDIPAPEISVLVKV